ncbi:MAG: bifunctional metallophosphatase/5'-nucleotidase [Bacteroidota bacterium]|uniref:Bifunctional metallophosphatase/5'-nucleotidase n=1 Tax=Flagellimonas profundi TaxID=2915620 RepID=A0ABS3FDY0_9FLAO|nr:bifunctional metallophosphatase/5'-nucleotidase [Allomuricauda profundi]MBO0341346.1 bifunctional metallophosphatase/5'-nucleotidase [Allomuricauda profundi]MEC7771232.1 bifunctional metallophosphatase/5'-nucleotidase [Bacteroidota bacterium]
MQSVKHWGLIALLIGTLSACKDGKTPAQDSEQTITILQTADIHGQLFPHDELFWEDEQITFRKLGGLAHVKTLFEDERSKNPEGTLILDGGDLIQGSAYAALSEGKAFSPIIQQMGYDFLIPGNWEVVYGKQTMMDVLTQYDTPVISANMYHEATGESLFPQYFVKELKGVKLGFISYNDPEIPVRQNPSFSEGIRFDPIDANLEALITELKDNQNVDVLFLVTHIGISKQYDLANNPALERVDYLLGNDTHERIRKPLQAKYTKVTEPGAFASFVGKLTLTVKDGQVVSEAYDLLEVDPKKYAADEKVAQIIETATAPYQEEANEVLGYTSVPLYRYFVVENPMDNFITDAARWKTGVDVSISNGFRFSTPISVEEGGKSPITKADLWSMLPVNEKVKIGKASGQQIKDWLEKELHNVFAQNPTERFGGWLVRFSGMELTFYANKPKGERVASIKIGGEPIQDDKLYTMSACRREGEPLHTLCRMPNTVETEVMDYTIHDVIEEYLKEKGTIAPSLDGRAKALDLGPNVLSQLPGTDYQFH